ncbi:cobalt ECF transporter T component CbiQ [Clostridium aminobutyricum]|uniref:Cobalt ECF transporter T component CbiQ n=1 Tax=Clostridium aminobutyricum TaxID=33953 RepID=A0A939D6C3_CLOAM|nr:cobalt ECF transporter T component CbiQ [Clostridium aminobutyricum]MBN7771900.1 cobalt ECF transporter T component CbiQ [Clostridium aminobutyricum]
MIVIDKLAYYSAIRDKSPFLKCAFAIGTLLICVAARSFVISFLVLSIMGCATVRYSRTSFFQYMKLMLAPLAFLAMGTVAIAVNWTSQPMDLFNIAVGDKFLAVSWYSIEYAVRLILVSLASISCLYFLTLTTTLLDLLYVLKRLHCPNLIIELMMMTYRFIFVLLEIAVSILTAQNCRLGNRSFRSSMEGMGGMLSVLLIRALDKSNRLFEAMESRCYDGELNVLQESKPSSWMEKGLILSFLIILTAIAIWCKINAEV